MATRLLPLQLFIFSLGLSTALTISLFALQNYASFIGINGKASGHHLWHKWWQHMGCTILSMVGATTIDNGNPLFLE
jgi:hypothetical protein